MQEARPDAEKLLQLPIFAEHEGCQEETMRAWLCEVGEPRVCCDEGDEPEFTNWNSNPLLPLLPLKTPREVTQEAGCGKRELSPPATVGGSSQSQVGDAAEASGSEPNSENDLSRVPLQFLSGSNLEDFEAQVGSVKKKAKTETAADASHSCS